PALRRAVHRGSNLYRRLRLALLRDGRRMDRDGAPGLDAAGSPGSHVQADLYRAVDLGSDHVAGEDPMTYANPLLLWSVDELKTRLHDPRLALMDLRPPEAYSNGHIPSARS